jgi:quinolinate synthase
VKILFYELQILLEYNRLLKYTQKDDAKEFIVVTETGIIHQMQKANPLKHLYRHLLRTIAPAMIAPT